MYLVYEFFSGYLQLLKLQLRLRRSYLHLNLNFRSSHHLHSVYVPLQAMYSWHDNTRKKKTSKLKHFVALYSFDFCCCCCWLIYSSWLRGAIYRKATILLLSKAPYVLCLNFAFQVSSHEMQYTAPNRSWRFCNTFKASKTKHPAP